MSNLRISLTCAAGLLLAAMASTAVAQAGPLNKPKVDPVSAANGQPLYATACAECHGPGARGTNKGADLMVSSVLLHDRYGSELGPFLLKGHPVAGGAASTTFSKAQILDLSNFLYQKFYETLSRRPPNPPPNIVVGNAAAGKAFFNGAGGCAGCHSITGDLAGIAKRDRAYQLQQSFVFPGGFHRGAPPPPPVTVAIAPASGPSVSGVLVHMDDFNVIYKDSAGQEHTVARAPGMTVTTKNPLAAHIALLKTITDRQIHDVVAYLETLQ
jgi:mono/diheme cytochrome c family protein